MLRCMSEAHHGRDDPQAGLHRATPGASAQGAGAEISRHGSRPYPPGHRPGGSSGPHYRSPTPRRGKRSSVESRPRRATPLAACGGGRAMSSTRVDVLVDANVFVYTYVTAEPALHGTGRAAGARGPPTPPPVLPHRARPPGRGGGGRPFPPPAPLCFGAGGPARRAPGGPPPPGGGKNPPGDSGGGGGGGGQ